MATYRKAKVAYLGSPWSDFNVFGVYSRVSMCLSWLHLFSNWLHIKVIAKRSFSRSNSKKMSARKAFCCLIQDLGRFVANCVPIKSVNNFIFINGICNPWICLPCPWLQIAPCPDPSHIYDLCMCAVIVGSWHVTETPKFSWGGYHIYRDETVTK